ncbi:hypothetical protein NBRC10512v2_001371 [Rhodotorula toruloides]
MSSSDDKRRLPGAPRQLDASSSADSSTTTPAPAPAPLSTLSTTTSPALAPASSRSPSTTASTRNPVPLPLPAPAPTTQPTPRLALPAPASSSATPSGIAAAKAGSPDEAPKKQALDDWYGKAAPSTAVKAPGAAGFEGWKRKKAGPKPVQKQNLHSFFSQTVSNLQPAQSPSPAASSSSTPTATPATARPTSQTALASFSFTAPSTSKSSPPKSHASPTASNTATSAPSPSTSDKSTAPDANSSASRSTSSRVTVVAKRKNESSGVQAVRTVAVEGRTASKGKGKAKQEDGESDDEEKEDEVQQVLRWGRSTDRWKEQHDLKKLFLAADADGSPDAFYSFWDGSIGEFASWEPSRTMTSFDTYVSSPKDALPTLEASGTGKSLLKRLESEANIFPNLHGEHLKQKYLESVTPFFELAHRLSNTKAQAPRWHPLTHLFGASDASLKAFLDLYFAWKAPLGDELILAQLHLAHDRRPPSSLLKKLLISSGDSRVAAFGIYFFLGEAIPPHLLAVNTLLRSIWPPESRLAEVTTLRALAQTKAGDPARDWLVSNRRGTDDKVAEYDQLKMKYEAGEIQSDLFDYYGLSLSCTELRPGEAGIFHRNYMELRCDHFGDTRVMQPFSAFTRPASAERGLDISDRVVAFPSLIVPPDTPLSPALFTAVVVHAEAGEIFAFSSAPYARPEVQELLTAQPDLTHRILLLRPSLAAQIAPPTSLTSVPSSPFVSTNSQIGGKHLGSKADTPEDAVIERMHRASETQRKAAADTLKKTGVPRGGGLLKYQALQTEQDKADNLAKRLATIRAREHFHTLLRAPLDKMLAGTLIRPIKPTGTSTPFLTYRVAKSPNDTTKKEQRITVSSNPLKEWGADGHYGVSVTVRRESVPDSYDSISFHRVDGEGDSATVGEVIKTFKGKGGLGFGELAYSRLFGILHAHVDYEDSLSAIQRAKREMLVESRRRSTVLYKQRLATGTVLRYAGPSAPDDSTSNQGPNSGDKADEREVDETDEVNFDEAGEEAAIDAVFAQALREAGLEGDDFNDIIKNLEKGQSDETRDTDPATDAEVDDEVSGDGEDSRGAGGEEDMTV